MRIHLMLDGLIILMAKYLSSLSLLGDEESVLTKKMNSNGKSVKCRSREISVETFEKDCSLALTNI